MKNLFVRKIFHWFFYTKCSSDCCYIRYEVQSINFHLELFFELNGILSMAMEKMKKYLSIPLHSKLHEDYRYTFFSVRSAWSLMFYLLIPSIGWWIIRLNNFYTLKNQIFIRQRNWHYFLRSNSYQIKSKFLITKLHVVKYSPLITIGATITSATLSRAQPSMSSTPFSRILLQLFPD